MPRLSVLLAAFIVPVCLPSWSQDTRTVTEPSFPPVCQRLLAPLTAGPTGLPADSETLLDTSLIQSALNTCPSGQAVELRPRGANNAFLIGPLQLPPGVTLLIDAGVTVFASRNPRDFDANASQTCGTITTANTGCLPLITANHADGAGIMGYGTIDGRGELPMILNGTLAPASWWDLANQANVSGKSQNCPRLIQVSNTNGFTLYKITLMNSPNFHVALGTDTNFTAWGVKIITPYDARNTDGIDPGYSTNVTIANSYISDGDDNVAVGGANPPGASHISVVNDYFGDGHGASIGSYTQAGVSDVLFDHITIAATPANSNATGLRIKSDVSRGGLVQNVTYSNICMQNVRAAIVLDPFYTAGATGSLVPHYQNIALTNVHATTEGTVKTQGHDASVPTTIALDNVQVDGIKSSDLSQQYVQYTLGPGPVNFASMLQGTGVTVNNQISTANPSPPYACPADAFAPIMGELIPGPAHIHARRRLHVIAQVITTKAISYQAWLKQQQTNPNAALAITAPTGTVTIYDGDTALRTATLTGSPLVKVAVGKLAPGAHTLTAVYSGDANYPSIAFGSYSLVVGRAQ
jgi:hypothetical protein